jgi:thymidylate synthase
MKEYLNLVRLVLENGTWKKSRTGVDTISYFGAFYRVDLTQGLPLLTTKEVNFTSCLRELLWYLSGEDHIRNLRQHTKIWDAWADENGNLETAYGRYWRRFPHPEQAAASSSPPGNPATPKPANSPPATTPSPSTSRTTASTATSPNAAETLPSASPSTSPATPPSPK